MIIGPYWCQRDKSWVRFNLENGVASAEIINMSSEDANSTWQAVAEGSWPTTYVYGSEKPENNFFSLKDGVLFLTDGKTDKYSGTLYASKFTADGMRPYNISRGIKENGFNPLSSYVKDSAELTPYQELPLPPDMVAAQLEQERALEEERLRQEQRLSQVEEAAKWNEYQNKNIRSLGKAAADSSLFFSEKAQGLLVQVLSTELLDITAKQFSNCSDYLQRLKIIIEDNTNPWHQAIITLASRTDVDREIGLFGDEELRKTLLQQKKSFFFNLLREEAKYLSNYFKIEYDILDDKVIAERQVEKSPHLVIKDPQYGDEDPNLDDKKILNQHDYDEGSCIIAIDDSYAHLSEEENLRWAIEASLVNVLGGPKDPEMKIQAIMSSLENVQNFDAQIFAQNNSISEKVNDLPFRQIPRATKNSMAATNHFGDQNFVPRTNLLINIYNECEKVFKDTLTGNRHKFFTPYGKGSDFVKSAGMTILDTVIFALAMDKYAAYLLLGAVVGAAALGAKGLVELAVLDSESANKSFEISCSILKFTISTAILVVLSPILDVVSLATRTATTLAKNCHSNDQIGSETIQSMSL